jgi:hypothetical protein
MLSTMDQGDIEQLREAHPLWRIGSVWASAASGPDARRLTASREGIQVHAWTAERLSACIAYEEEQHGWPASPPAPRSGRGLLQDRLTAAQDWDSKEVNQAIARDFGAIG